MAPLQAVLTADIVNSTLLSKLKEKKLLKTLEQVLEAYRYEFFRGDSFQVYLKEPRQALKTALCCRAAAIMESEKRTRYDVRFSIGVGTVHAPVQNLGTAKGEAFLLSGRGFDDISKTDTKLYIVTPNSLANAGLQAIADHANAIFKDMTGKQAAVIFELLMGAPQLAIAGKLKKSKSTISQHVQAGRWAELEKLLKQYEIIMNLML